MDIYETLLHKMETLDVMDYELFDLDGKNYCPADGTISLKKFIDDDNALKFYSLTKKVNLIKKIIKDNGKKALVEFEIFFQKPDAKESGPSLICNWVIELTEDKKKITSIDSFWSVPEFKQKLEQHYPEYLKLFFRK